MTLDLGGPNRNVFYLNFETRGTYDPDNLLGTQICRANQEFNFANLIENASDYVVAIERFRLPLQGIPMLRRIPAAIFIRHGGTNAIISTLNLPEIYSLNDFLDALNPDGPGWTPPGSNSGFFFNLTPGGQICITGPWGPAGAGEYLELSPQIAAIFDLPEIVGDNLSAPTTVLGASVLFDRFDELYKIQIVAESGLSNIQQEIVTTNTFRNILTDFLIPSSFSASYTNNGTCDQKHNPAYSLSYPVRQDLEFNDSANRRWIFLRGGAPIQNVGLKAEAILRDGTVQDIPLPPRSVFQVKLSWWLKT